MRLLKLSSNGQIELHPFDDDKIPQYAILSHTWGKDCDEVTFDDITNGTGTQKEGFKKIQFCGDQAARDGLEFFWVDTCCIDKTNHTELSEAIISMFRWYSRAKRCYVYLSNVSARKRVYESHEAQTGRVWESSFRTSRWFKRGWTLQELLAPTSVGFFSREGHFLGDKIALSELVRDITGIPTSALHGAPLSEFSIERRFHWATGRETKRVEDNWYCLQGIFGVFMLPMYGEGENAFVRLKDEINRSYRQKLDEIVPDIPSSNSRQSNNVRGEPHPLPVREASIYDRRKDLLTSLSFDRIESRRSTIKKAYSTTCEWFLQHPSYRDWIDPIKSHEHNGFLWINGKPGAGKSTLVNFAYEHSKRQGIEDEVLLSFFFNARGDELEKSTMGMYRSLVLQLLEKAVDLQNILDNLHSSGVHQEDNSPTWTIKLLQECLSLAVERLGQRQLKFYIDALDECDEQQIREMVIFFDELGEKGLTHGNQLYVCFASRHYPAIDIRTGLRLTLEDEQGHGEDLRKYVQRHLRAGQGKYIDEVRMHIQEKANGVFMWAVLVVDILNKEFLSGRIFAVQKRLKEIPSRLSDLFKDILRRDSANLTELLLCLQWILFARRPLKREEFYFAMVAGLDPEQEYTAEWNPEHVTLEDMNRFVLNSSKGFAELTRTKTPTVQFIHESVRDFLLKDNGLYELWPDLRGDITSSSHDQLKQCCQQYLNINVSDYATPDEMSLKASSDFAKDLRKTLHHKFPFLEYASRYVLEHSDQAGRLVPQDDFLQNFALKTWLSVTNLLERYEIRRYTSEASLLYILAESNLARLIRTLKPNASDFYKRGERYYYPFFAALANGHREAVRALLEPGHNPVMGDLTKEVEFGREAAASKEHGPLSSPLLWALEKRHPAVAEAILSFPDVGCYLTDHELSNSLLWAGGNGNERVVGLLLANFGFDLDAYDNNHQRTPLSYAAERGQTGVVRLLLNKGAKTEILSMGMTALQWAVIGGQEKTLQQLIDYGANIETPNSAGESALIVAARVGHEGVVQQLVGFGADLEATDHEGRTALLLAAYFGQEATVQQLLELGARLEAVDNAGCSPLLLATKKRHVTTVQRLLQRGASVEAADHRRRTPLSHASELRDEKIVSTLLANRANVASKDLAGIPVLLWLLVPQQPKRLDLQCQSIFLEYLNERRPLTARGEVSHTSSQEAKTDADLASYQHKKMELTSNLAKIVHLLLANGASINITGPGGKTALMVAVARRRYASIDVLIRNGASLEARDDTGKTALFWAVMEKDVIAVHQLLDGMADIEAQDNEGRTVFTYLAENYNDTISQLLRGRALRG